MQFVTVTVAGLAPRGFLGVGAPPGPAQIQSAIANIFQSDGFTAQSITVKAAETGLIDFVSSGSNPYTATVVLAVNDADNPAVVAQTIGQEIGKALGQPVDTIGAPISSASPAIPEAPASSPSWLSSVEPVLILLAVLGVVALVVLHKVEA